MLLAYIVTLVGIFVWNILYYSDILVVVPYTNTQM